MKSLLDGRIVIERQLNCACVDPSTAILRIEGVDQISGHGSKATAWSCSWSLAPLHPTPQRIFGEDPLHALTNCLSFLRDLFERYQRSGLTFWWLHEGDL